MSMKRCFELSFSPSVSLLGRVILIGSALSFAAACARKDAAKTDSTVASADSATTTTSATNSATPASPVESTSAGETAISAQSKASPSVATKPAAAPVAAHHATHRTDSTTKAAPAAASAAAPAPAATTTAVPAGSADTGQKTAAAGAVDHLLVSPQEYEGWKMFSVYCYRCHGVDAMGGGIAPNLRHSVSSEGSVTHDVFITTVTNGRLDKGMPTWKALLSPEQMEDLWLYVNARSSNRLYPGRPHMAQGANP
jgi:mono/diheme cytochrome c family protein